MTNNPTIDGVSRELIERLVNNMELNLGGNREALRALLDSPDSQPANPLRDHCKQCAEVVKTWPEWKQNCLGDAPAVERQDRTAHSMKSVAEAVDASRCYTVLTSNQCYALAKSLNNQAVRVSAAENSALQSTIAQLEDKLNKAIDLDFQRRETIEQLQARIGELESGRGEPVMKLEAERLWGGAGEYVVSFVKSGWLDECRKTGGEFLLYVAPPLPVAAVLPERKSDSGREWNSHYVAEVEGWNACLDATAALNEDRKRLISRH